MRSCCLVLAASLTACMMSEPESVDETTQDVDTTNGRSLNGTSLNGTSLNGRSLNGRSLNGTSVNGRSLNGTSLSAISTTAPPVTGASVVGSTWTGTASDGTSLPLRIDSAVQGTDKNSDLWFYNVSYQTTTGWSPICGTDATGAPILAVPVAGVWSALTTDSAHYAASTTSYTWACRGKSVAKCVELGYKTFKGYTDGMRACVRLLRADYCGTGQSHTVDGTLLNLYDKYGVQLDTEAWGAEAVWGVSGAVCVNANNRTRYQLAQQSEPTCVVPLVSATCGSSYPTGGLLIDELP